MISLRVFKVPWVYGNGSHPSEDKFRLLKEKNGWQKDRAKEIQMWYGIERETPLFFCRIIP
jgi:hypothetical protein